MRSWPGYSTSMTYPIPAIVVQQNHGSITSWPCVHRSMVKIWLQPVCGAMPSTALVSARVLNAAMIDDGQKPIATRFRLPASICCDALATARLNGVSRPTHCAMIVSRSPYNVAPYQCQERIEPAAWRRCRVMTGLTLMFPDGMYGGGLNIGPGVYPRRSGWTCA